MPTILLAGYRLPMKAERILKEILESAGLSSARISDTTRDFDRQAKVIVDYYNLNDAAAAKKLLRTVMARAAWRSASTSAGISKPRWPVCWIKWRSRCGPQSCHGAQTRGDNAHLISISIRDAHCV